MTFEDWIFGLHVTMAALLVGSLVMSWIVIVSLLTTDTPRLTLSLHRVKLVATGATIIGLLGRGFIPDNKKLRRALEVDDDRPASIFWEQYDNTPVIDVKNPDLVADLRRQLHAALK